MTQALVSTKITLIQWEQDTARDLAAKRYGNNRAAGINDGKIGPQSVEFTDLQGVAGEIAAARYYNLYPDFSIWIRTGTPDLHTHGGLSIDVKTTEWDNGHLQAKTGTPLTKAAIYVLVRGNFPTYEIIGWTFADCLISDKTIVDRGWGPTHELPNEELADPEELHYW